MLTEDRQSHWAHLLLEALQEENAIEDQDRGQVLKLIKNYLGGTLKKFELVLARCEQKVQSTKKNLVPGSREYQLQLERMFQEEIRKV